MYDDSLMTMTLDTTRIPSKILGLRFRRRTR